MQIDVPAKSSAKSANKKRQFYFCGKCIVEKCIFSSTQWKEVIGTLLTVVIGINEFSFLKLYSVFYDKALVMFYILIFYCGSS